MEIVDVIHLTNEPVIPGGFAHLGSYTFDDLESQQRHREVLLRDAEFFGEGATQAGCVSEISIVVSAIDSDEYQEIVRGISDLYRNVLAMDDALEMLERRTGEKMENYDDSGLFEVMSEPLSEVMQVSENDVEELGYMGWLVLA